MHLSQNAVFAFAMLYGRKIGIINIEWLFIMCGVTSLIAQPLLGRLSDKHGRWQAISIAFVLHIVAILLFVRAATIFEFVSAGMCYMTGLAIRATVSQALAMDQASEDQSRRGQILGGFAMSFPLSNLIGGLAVGGTVQWFGYQFMYLLMVAISLAGLVVTIAHRSSMGAQQVTSIA